jgi:hypothetical protein
MRRGEVAGGPMLWLAFGGCGGKAAGGAAAARRGGRRRQRRRLPCAARSPGPLANSLRARKRALRSDIARESDDEAREYARGQEKLRCSAPPMRAAAMPPTALRNRGAPSKNGHSDVTPVSAQAEVGQGLGRTCGGEPGHKQSGGLFVPCERPGACARCGLQGEQRRASGRACTHAHPHLTRAQCLSKANAVSGASWGAGQKPEQRRGARAPARAAAYKPQALAHPRLSRHHRRSTLVLAGSQSRI